MPVVLTAVLFGLAASSALVVGATAGAWWTPPERLIGVLLAFASGGVRGCSRRTPSTIPAPAGHSQRLINQW